MRAPAYRKLVTIFLMAASGAVGIGFVLGHRTLQQMRQVQSYAVLQTMRDTVEHIPGGSRSADTLRSALRNVANGHDAWGNDVHVFTKNRPGFASYVLVSYGADGSSDVRTPDEYFVMASTDIRDDVRKDIVVRDGELVTFAGK